MSAAGAALPSCRGTGPGGPPLCLTAACSVWWSRLPVVGPCVVELPVELCAREVS